jgi:hypothetical protein
MVNENDAFDMVPELIDDTQPLEFSDDNTSEELIEEQEIDETAEEIDEQLEIEEQEKSSPEDVELAQSFYALLQERQLVPEKEVNSWEELEEEIDKYKTDLPNQVRESIINSTSSVAQDFINFAVNKPDLTQEDLNTYFQALQEDNSRRDIETNDQARETLKPSLVAQWGEDTADILLDSLEDKDELITRAKSVNDSKSQKLTQEAQAQREQQEQQNQEFVNNIFESFDAQPWQAAHTTKVKEFYTNGKADEVIQQITQDPKSLVQLVNLLSYYDSTKKEFNLDTFFNKAATKQVSSIKENIKRGLQNRGTSTKHNKKDDGLDLSKFSLA